MRRRGRGVDGPGHSHGKDGGRRPRSRCQGEVLTVVLRQTSRNRKESTNSGDDDDDDNNNNNNDDSDCSLESVDLTSCDVDYDDDDDDGKVPYGDDGKVPSETVRTAEETLQTDLSMQRLKSDRNPAAEVVAHNDDNASVEFGGDDDCDVVKSDAFGSDTQAHQHSSLLDKRACNLLSTAGNSEVGSAAVPCSTGQGGSAVVDSRVRRQIFQHRDVENEGDENRNRRTSVFDDLLFDIYDRWHAGWRDSFDSDTFTDLTESDVPCLGRHDWNPSETESDKRRLNLSALQTKDVCELEQMISDVCHRVSQMSSHLVRQLKCRARRLAALREKYDIVTAILHASSLKRRIDSKIRFSIEPFPGDDAFGQWKDAMKAIARLPLGIPTEFRKNVWLALADNYLSGLCIDWDKTKRLAFNEKSNPDDSKLGLQIVKDLHRTGCSGFNGQDNEEDRAVLKRVLLAYARWNKLVGYCQGFNILAALILDVVDRKEDCALKVMIYLVDRVLPESYFANNLRALSVDMAVFRELLHTHLMPLSKHLDHLQNAARDQTTGASYEPPLTNVFTMQWFLTLFATCLPKSVALQVWDSVLLEGSETLLRTAIAIWGTLESRILNIPSADEFYSSMGVLSQEMLDGKIVSADKLMKDIYTMAPFPFPQLTELREKYTYNITPFTASLNSGRHHQPATSQSSAGGAIFADDEDFDEDELIENINCFAGLFLPQHLSPSATASNDTDSSSDVSKASPGAYAVTPVDIAISLPACADRVTLDISMLHKQYKRLKQRQRQAHIILAAANARQKQSQAVRTGGQNPRMLSSVAMPTDSPAAVNHLFVSRQMMNSRNRNGPRGSATVDSYDDDYRGRSSLSIPQQASKLARSNQRHADCRLSLKLLHNHLGKALLEGPSSDVRSRSGSVASVNGSEDGSVGCDSNSCVSVHSDKSCGSVGTDDMLKDPTKPAAVDSTDACDCITCEMPNNAIFESPSELDETLRAKPSDGAACSPALETVDSNDTSAQGRECSEEGQSSLTGSTPESKKTVCNNTQMQSIGIKLQDLKVDHDPASEINSSEPLIKSSLGKAPLCSADATEEFHRSSTNKPFKDFGGISVEQKTNAQVNLEGSSSSEVVVKVFNPFPKQYLHPRKTRNNIRMGLYSEMDAGAMGSEQIKRSNEQLQRTAYLQRQYMMQMTQQSKANKS